MIEILTQEKILKDKKNVSKKFIFIILKTLK